MRHLPIRSLLGAVVLGTLVLALAACGGSTESSAAEETEAVTTEAESPEATVETDDSEVTETEAEEEAAEATGDSGSSAGAAAAAGEGTLTVNGTVYAFTIDECSFQGDGPTGGTFEVNGTTADGEPFEMVQFFLNGDWSQSSVQIDRAGGTEVYVIRTAATEGAEPATVSGKNITWTETYFELDPAANEQVSIGEGVVNLTCA